jgi:hypothetical protein
MYSTYTYNDSYFNKLYFIKEQVKNKNKIINNTIVMKLDYMHTYKKIRIFYLNNNKKKSLWLYFITIIKFVKKLFITYNI